MAVTHANAVKFVRTLLEEALQKEPKLDAETVLNCALTISSLFSFATAPKIFMLGGVTAVGALCLGHMKDPVVNRLNVLLYKGLDKPTFQSGLAVEKLLHTMYQPKWNAFSSGYICTFKILRLLIKHQEQSKKSETLSAGPNVPITTGVKLVGKHEGNA